MNSMTMRNIMIAPGEYYHVCNRGVNKQVIFHNSDDYFRFLFLILYFQSPITFEQTGRVVKEFVGSPALDISVEIIKKRTVELTAFCIMANHFHLIIREVEEDGIVSYMQRVLTAYSKYYNTKYEKSGHVFQGPYRAVHVIDDRQMLHTSAYIHRNPREMKEWTNREEKYQWSSYQDHVGENRWGGLLIPDVISGQFRNKKDYRHFVETSPTKKLKEELEYLEIL